MRFLGVVLAGGLSRRMEGQEKALMKIGGKPLITHVADRFSRQVPQVLINANGDPDRYDFLGLPVQADTVAGFAGPLAGVLAAMRWAQENSNATHIVTAAADTPFFPDDYVDQMMNSVQMDTVEIVIARSNDRNHPVFALWPVRLADDLEHFLTVEKENKVMLFADRYSVSTVTFEARDIDPFFNVNTPADLEQAEVIAKNRSTS